MKTPPYSTDLGLLIIRIGMGGMFILHGLPKLLDGPGSWENLGQYGLPILPAGNIAMAFGLAAALAELLGGLALILGYGQRIACILLIATMAVAFKVHLDAVGSWADFAQNAGWPLELIFVFTGLLIAGPGKYRLGEKNN